MEQVFSPHFSFHLSVSFHSVLLFLPVSILPPILYTQSFIYHQNYENLTTQSVIKWHKEPQLCPKPNVHQHQYSHLVQWRALCRPDQLLEHSVPQNYTATYRSQYYRTMTWNDWTRPTWTLCLEGCRVIWYRQLENANHCVVVYLKKKNTLLRGILASYSAMR
jgi:hypothetical protein